MILIDKLYRKRLKSIVKNYNEFILVFEENGYNTKVKFEGFLIESEFSTLEEKVLNVKLCANLGISGLDILRYYRLNPIDYKQIIIEFEKTNHRETDLICIFKSYEIK